MRRAAGALAAPLLALGLLACGGGSSSGSGPGSSSSAATSAPAGSTSTTTTRASRPARPVVRGASLGTRQAVHTHGAELTVTVTRVLALSHTRTPALPGTRQVGVLLRIANQSGETYDSTSSGDVSLRLARGQAQPLDVRAGPCMTPLVDFESMIGSGDVRSGCAAFSVPRGVRVLAVRFSPHARTPGTLTWRAR